MFHDSPALGGHSPEPHHMKPRSLGGPKASAPRTQEAWTTSWRRSNIWAGPVLGGRCPGLGVSGCAPHDACMSIPCVGSARGSPRFSGFILSAPLRTFPRGPRLIASVLGALDPPLLLRPAATWPNTGSGPQVAAPSSSWGSDLQGAGFLSPQQLSRERAGPSVHRSRSPVVRVLTRGAETMPRAGPMGPTWGWGWSDPLRPGARKCH